MTYGDDDDEKSPLFKFAPPFFLAAGSFCFSQAVSAGWGNAGLILGFVGFFCIVLWRHAEDYQRAGGRLTQLKDLLTSHFLSAKSQKYARRKLTRRPARLAKIGAARARLSAGV